VTRRWSSIDVISNLTTQLLTYLIIYLLTYLLIHLSIQEERRARERRSRDEAMEQYRRDRELDEVEEAQFQSYARDVIQHCEQRGRNTYPLRRAAAAAAASRQVS